MSLWTRTLRWLGERFPQKTLHGCSGPYLTRYTLIDRGPRGALYLHRFHRGDEDQELHSHPWWALGVRLAGRYREERRFANGNEAVRARAAGWRLHGVSGADATARAVGHWVLWRDNGPGDAVRLEPGTFHRIDLLDEEAWSLLMVGARAADWGFWNRWTGTFTQWERFIARKFDGAS